MWGGGGTTSLHNAALASGYVGAESVEDGTDCGTDARVIEDASVHLVAQQKGGGKHAGVCLVVRVESEYLSNAVVELHVEVSIDPGEARRLRGLPLRAGEVARLPGGKRRCAQRSDLRRRQRC